MDQSRYLSFPLSGEKVHTTLQRFQVKELYHQIKF